MNARATRHPGGGKFPGPRRKVAKTPKKSAWPCSFAIPQAIAATAVVLAQLAAVKFWTRRAS